MAVSKKRSFWSRVTKLISSLSLERASSKSLSSLRRLRQPNERQQEGKESYRYSLNANCFTESNFSPSLGSFAESWSDESNESFLRLDFFLELGNSLGGRLNKL